jgi:predicted RNA-binding Zn-ribbon protein involved in translation (DUF1610 family)
MPMNRIQFQPGLSRPAFYEPFGTEAHCEAALEPARWSDGFRCPQCGEARHYVLHLGAHKTFQCQTCRSQSSRITGTLFRSAHSTLTLRFLAIDLISPAKTGMSAFTLKCQLGVSYLTAWLIQHTLMPAMAAPSVVVHTPPI